MSPLIFSIFIGVVLFAGLLMIFVFLRSRKRKLAPHAAKKVREVWLLIERIEDPVRQIMEADKVLDFALNLSGFKGTTGEKMKQAGPRFTDENGLWRAHKLRNTLAHELHAKIDKKQSASALAAFRQALRDLGMR